MDFYSYQEDARRRSRSLLWRFIVANILVVAIASGVIIGAIECYIRDSQHTGLMPSDAKHLEQAVGRLRTSSYIPLLVPFNLFLVCTICLSAFLKFRDLCSSGGAVAQMLGGERISSETADPLERRFINVIEEMAIASNMPVPEAYVLQGQRGINAFASGPSPEHSAVAVTRGALERLTRDELQGVVAHEFSHIMHADVRLNLRVAAYIYGLMVVMDLGYQLIQMSSRPEEANNSNDSHPDPSGFFYLIGALLMGIGLLGKVVSLLISAAVSREREYLADATAVELTRSSTGISGALQKIGGFKHGSRVPRSATQGLSHFFLAEASRASFFGDLFSTHPPLVKRIRRVDPSFSGTFPRNDLIPLQTGLNEEMVAQFAGGGSSLPPERSGFVDTMGRGFEVPFLNNAWMPPFEIHGMIVDVGMAEGTVGALLLSEDRHVRAKQEPILSVWVPENGIHQRADLLAGLSINQKLSAILMALPTIQIGSELRRKTFQGSLTQLVEVDGKESLLEFLALVLISYALLDTDPSFSIYAASSGDTLQTARAPLSVVFSACASFAAHDDARRCELLQKASASLNVECELVSEESRRARAFLGAVQRLRNLTPNARADLMSTLQLMVLADGKVSDADIAVMRLFSILLRAPLPTVFDQGAPELICQNN